MTEPAPGTFECDCCHRGNVDRKTKGIGYLCDDCIGPYTWDPGRYPPQEDDPGSHWPACPFRRE
jgi:hypothetical protein